MSHTTAGAGAPVPFSKLTNHKDAKHSGKTKHRGSRSQNLPTPPTPTDLLQEAIAGLTAIVKKADESRSKTPGEMEEGWSTKSATLAQKWIEQLHGVTGDLPVANIVEFDKAVERLKFRISMVVQGAQFPESWFQNVRPLMPQSAAQYPWAFIPLSRQSLEQINRIGSLLLLRQGSCSKANGRLVVAPIGLVMIR